MFIIFFHLYLRRRLIGIMRVQYNYLSEAELDSVLNPFKNYGGGLDEISYYRPQVRGGNIFGIVGNLFRKAFPIIKSLVLPELGTLAQNVTHDYAQHGQFRDSFKKNLSTSAKNIGRKILGGKRVQSRKKCNSSKKKKQRKKNKFLKRRKGKKT